MSASKKLSDKVSRSVAIAERNMMYAGFGLEGAYPPVVYYEGKTHEEVFEKIIKVIDIIVATSSDVNTIHLGYVGFDDINSAITKEGSGYKAFVSICGTMDKNDEKARAA